MSRNLETDKEVAEHLIGWAERKKDKADNLLVDAHGKLAEHQGRVRFIRERWPKPHDDPVWKARQDRYIEELRKDIGEAEDAAADAEAVLEYLKKVTGVKP